MSVASEKQTGPRSTTRRLYGSCPNCGAYVAKATPGSEMETRCSKCSSSLLVMVDMSGRVTTEVIQEGKVS